MIWKSLRCATRPVAEKRRRGEGDDEDSVGCSWTEVRRHAVAVSQPQQPIDARAQRGLNDSTTMAKQAVLHAYRHVLRHSLRAIQFSKPARYTLRDRLRWAFRKGTASDFDQQKITNTVEFLQYAAKQNGLEHKILKNLLLVWWHQDKGGRTRTKSKSRYVLLLLYQSHRR